MNKGSIKNYAIWARNELIQRVTQRAYEYGVEKDNIIPTNEDSIRGKILTNDEKNKRRTFITEVNQKGYDQVIEEVAYTWFNRFIALRFMEVNNYLPNKVRVFTNENNEFKPQILDEALNVDIPGLDKRKVFDLYQSNNSEELYKELLLATCNDMHQYLPGMFETIDDYKVLLFPNNLLRESSVLGRLISDIDEDSWTDQVQIIGWLYQYYIFDKHEKVININKGSVDKKDIPAATQLFTTDWIVHYMVDNTLGRYWLESTYNSDLNAYCNYLTVNKKYGISVVNKIIKPEEIKFIDPCMGSGHILVYAFDVLMQIYISEGWTERDAAKSILKNNLYGLDIDERAYQLSYFALMMKARQYNRRILSEGIIPNVMAIEESNNFNRDLLVRFGDELKPLATRLIDTFIDAKEYGSIINVEFTKEELDKLDKKLDEIYKMADYGSLVVQAESYELVEKFDVFLRQARIMSSKYDCAVTNPPYLNKMSRNLKEYASKYYKDYSMDLFSVFIKKNLDFTVNNGYAAYMTPFVWMFIRTYEKLRKYILDNKTVVSLIQLEYSAFEDATVPVCTYIIKNALVKEKGIYIRLSDFKGGMSVQNKKVLDAIRNDCSYWYETSQEQFQKIPGLPFAYWASNAFINSFTYPSVKEVANSCIGMRTGDNDRFLRLWFEVVNDKIGFNLPDESTAVLKRKKWIPYLKGGDFRRWYGNNDYVVNWENNGKEIKENTRKVYPQLGDNLNWKITNERFYFKKGITWSAISSSKTGFRKYDQGFIFSNAGQSIISNEELKLDYLNGLLNSKVVLEILKMIAPTIRFESGEIGRIPVCFSEEKNMLVNNKANYNVNISRIDWDSFETSWDFIKHPLVRGLSTIKESYDTWESECLDRFNLLKENEEELNRIFIDIYGLQDELTPEVEDKDVTVRKADLQREIKSLISYAVGCMFGRYSLDTDGLAYAGGEWDNEKYKSFIPDDDNIIPICDDEYFEDDIVHRFVEFIKVAYGEDTLEENLQFIASVLGGTGTPREIIRSYFLNDFFKDHCNTYQITGSGKRPIYWQFDSGKKNGFKALMYIHRYTPDLIARMRTSYIHELQSKYTNQISMTERQVESATSTSERVKIQKRLTKLREQEAELRKYEELVHHWADRMEPMDLDDGVKVNYARFQELLTKIK